MIRDFVVDHITKQKNDDRLCFDANEEGLFSCLLMRIYSRILTTILLLTNIEEKNNQLKANFDVNRWEQTNVDDIFNLLFFTISQYFFFSPTSTNRK